MAAASQTMENMILLIGGKRKFQLTILFLAAFTYMPLVLNHVIMAFHGAAIPHKCMAGSEIIVDTNTTDLSVGSPYVTNVTHSKCSSTVGYSDGQEKIIGCTSGQWKYFPKSVEWNIVSEFDLVCSKKYLVSMATTIYFTGVMLGGLVFGDLADRFGRLPVMLFTLYASIIVGLTVAFSVNYLMFVCLRFIHGVLIQGLQTSAYTLIMELFGPKDRPFAGIMAELFFGVTFMILAGLAYGLRHWQHLQIAASLVAVVTLFYPWVVPESLRWLIMKGKLEKAEKQIQRICKTNKISFPSECWEELRDTAGIQAKALKQYNLTHLFRSWSMAKVSLISFYLW
ncbi:solute carrier family 22 member 6-A [Elysia marginata]|uniref:Solute carrier family 22 member 6-A n=1 Tax=Elysia marginata TaxID=1093978 RepID=A0AAV4GLK6_9GAST|nr:solute carrier family 22 member 6-A [Elysia marginata]